MHRRRFLQLLGVAASTPLVARCGGDPDPGRYTDEDVARLARQRTTESASAGKGPFGPQRYDGYRGLAELPWFEIDTNGVLRCVADDFPEAIDFHCHLGMSMLFAPELDLLVETPRVAHLLDCDARDLKEPNEPNEPNARGDLGDPGCPLDLDVYINGNFSQAALRRLRWETVSQALWGSAVAATHTIPNLLREMDASRVGQAVVLPIAFNFPFGDDLASRWHTAVETAGAEQRLLVGASVHPRDPDRIAALEAQAARGAQVVKLHPTVQRFYPDDASVMELYAECERLGLVVFFHGGRAGIEPKSSQPYAMPRHYEGALASFPNLQFVLGHGGARDGEAMRELAGRYQNAWLGIHGQSVTELSEMIRLTGGRRLLFGTDWPWYHLAATLAKVLIVTEDRPELRTAILRDNAERLLAAAAPISVRAIRTHS